jgi:D-aminopeptidase
VTSSSESDVGRPRAREIGVRIGELSTGEHNAIVDVPGVHVGHVSLISGSGRLKVGTGPIRTGVTAILPHEGNLYQDRPCAAVHIINAYGKSTGLPQIIELGHLETPILLTGTLSVWNAANAMVDYIAEANPGLATVNPVVGECNDGYLNDILGRHIGPEHVLDALANASNSEISEGNVGAGVGMTGFGWKGGIGSSSRIVTGESRDHTIGVLVLTNTGSPEEFRIDGIPVGRELTPQMLEEPDGSIMIIVATDAPMTSRQLGRVAKRAAFGLARAGGTASHGSGDFVIAFSNGHRTSPSGHRCCSPDSYIPEPELSRFFSATIDATEEAIINSILKAETLTGRDGNTRVGIPIDRVQEIIKLNSRNNAGG